MTLGRIIILVLLVLSGWFVWRDQTRKNDKAEWEKKLSGVLRPEHFSKARTEKERESAAWIMIAVAWEAQRAHDGDVDFVMADAIRNGARTAGLSAGEADAVADTLIANTAACRRCGVLENPESLQQMLAGDPPVIRNGIYAGEKMRLAPIVPAALAPAAAWHPGNLQAVPEPVAFFSSIRIPTERVLKTAQQLNNGGILPNAILENLRKTRDAIAKQQ